MFKKMAENRGLAHNDQPTRGAKFDEITSFECRKNQSNSGKMPDSPPMRVLF
jgi:hypothetical protein